MGRNRVISMRTKYCMEYTDTVLWQGLPPGWAVIRG